jgi:hypothetical protein
MPAHLILKPDPAEDLYVVWINAVDGPSAWGTRAEIEKELDNPVYLDDSRKSPADPERFARADRTGTSSLVDGELTGKIVYSPPRVDGSPGWIARERMAAWLHSGLNPTYLEPLDDEEPTDG